MTKCTVALTTWTQTIPPFEFPKAPFSKIAGHFNRKNQYPLANYGVEQWLLSKQRHVIAYLPPIRPVLARNLGQIHDFPMEVRPNDLLALPLKLW
jgi:hypothetical protein